MVSIVSALLLFATFLATAQTANHPKKQDIEFFKGKKVAARQVLVKFRKSATRQDVEEAKKNVDSDFDKKVGGTGVQLLRSRSKDTATLISELSARSDVLYAEPNYVIGVAGTPNDSSFSGLWGLQNTGQVVGGSAGTQGADISAAPAWDISTGSRANVVAVVDTGVDYNHPDLAANMWTAPAAFTVNIGGQAIRCEAGTHGFNAITKTCDPMDEYNHGTHVAGTIGARGNNGAGVVGVNWTANIMAVKFIGISGSGTLEDAIDAIEFTIQAKAAFAGSNGANVRVLSNSWGWNGGASLALLEEIKRAESSDMLFVASAGNGGSDQVSDNNDASPFYPASYDAPSVISVAATNNRDALAYFSNYGASSVDLAAPGVDVLSTTMGGLYDSWSGTSMASPHVSGAAALLLSRCSLDTANLKRTLLNNVDPVSSLGGITTTGGRLNVNKAIRSCVNLPAAPTIELTNVNDGDVYPVYSYVTIQANASDSDGVVSRVDYYVDGKLIDTAQAPPYTGHWYATAVGEYTLTGVATDDTGMTTTSSPVKLIINETIIPEPEPTPTPNQPPTVSLTSPSAGAAYDAPVTIKIGADASDPDGSVSKVQFYSNNQLIGTAATSPYSITWSNVAAGSYSLQAVVTDNGGITVGSNLVNVTVNQSPASPACASPVGTVAWYPAEGNANDAQVNHTGALEGGAAFAPGRVGRALSLDGSNDFVSVPDADDLDVTNDITIEGWINPSNMSGERVILSKRSPGGNDITYTLRLVGIDSGEAAGKLEFSTRSAGGSIIAAEATGFIPANQFTHVAFTLQGSSYSFYINGQPAGQSTLGGLINRPVTAGRLTIGAKEETAGASGFFAGNLDEITLYGRALSTAEVQTIFNQGGGGKCSQAPPEINIADVAGKTEGNTGTSNAVFSVTLSKASTQTVKVDFQTQPGTAQPGADYQQTSGTVEFTPGQTAKSITIPVVGDTEDEQNETFFVELSNPVGAGLPDAHAQATITDDDAAPGLKIDSVTVTEPDVDTIAASFTVTLSARTWQTVKVNYATADGTAMAVGTTSQPSDYTATSGTLTFAPGETAKTVAVIVKGDTRDEANESFKVLLSSPVNASITAGTGTGTIADNDAAPSLRVSSPFVTEANTATVANFTVSLSAASGQTVKVNYATANGTAVAPSDYAAKALTTLTFMPGQTTQTVSVTIAGDQLDEAAENFKLVLSSSTNATIAAGTGTCTITDDDPPPSITISNVTVTEPDSGAVAATFLVKLSAASGQTVSVKYVTANGTSWPATAGTDYTAVALTTLTFLPGQTAKSITIQVKGDLIKEKNETFFVNLSGALNATIADNQGLGTITNDD
ncbi:MAG TPA: Calx-beta domain-containing protein [Pyrinomonadaceae bacterium]|nr:Calx-beta domain-containing protein [Pyrinomonadaceae bacterium]